MPQNYSFVYLRNLYVNQKWLKSINLELNSFFSLRVRFPFSSCWLHLIQFTLLFQVSSPKRSLRWLLEYFSLFNLVHFHLPSDYVFRCELELAWLEKKVWEYLCTKYVIVLLLHLYACFQISLTISVQCVQIPFQPVNCVFRVRCWQFTATISVAWSMLFVILGTL